MLVDIVMESAFQKTVQKIKEAETKAIILQQLEKLRENPVAGKKLSGNLAHKYSLRFSQYRMIYEIKLCPNCQQSIKNKLSCETINPAQANLCVCTLYIEDVCTRQDAYK